MFCHLAIEIDDVAICFARPISLPDLEAAIALEAEVDRIGFTRNSHSG
ncbi:MAG: hypothetical protein KME17_31335 [Cyanosarcina radialis HA8281-LM2]|jgi:hypothetical protein|nr:hypothetical protein [Cyanosarcina radialis HA8281-LM2]